MLAYVQAFINIVLRRSGPEDLPDSVFLLGLTLAVYFATQGPLALLAFGPTVLLVRTVIVSLALMFGGVWILLRLAGYRARYRRTVTALLGTSALFSIISIPFSLWRHAMVDTDTGVGLPSTFLFAIMLWSIAVDGHILARALSKPFMLGLFISVGFFFLQETILFEMMPTEAGR